MREHTSEVQDEQLLSDSNFHGPELADWISLAGITESQRKAILFQSICYLFLYSSFSSKLLEYG